MCRWCVLLVCPCWRETSNIDDRSFVPCLRPITPSIDCWIRKRCVQDSTEFINISLQSSFLYVTFYIKLWRKMFLWTWDQMFKLFIYIMIVLSVRKHFVHLCLFFCTLIIRAHCSQTINGRPYHLAVFVLCCGKLTIFWYQKYIEATRNTLVMNIIIVNKHFFFLNLKVN